LKNVDYEAKAGTSNSLRLKINVVKLRGLIYLKILNPGGIAGEEKEDNVVQDISNTEELATSTDLEDEENILEDDPMLYEAGNILGDQIMMMTEYNPSKLAVIDQNE
jgi:hypothetical protein